MDRVVTLRELVEEGLVAREDVRLARGRRRPFSRQYATDLIAGRAPVSGKVAAALAAARPDVIREVRIVGPGEHGPVIRFVLRAHAQEGAA